MGNGTLSAVLTILAGIIYLIVHGVKDRAASDTPEERAKRDKKKVENAIAIGDVDTINDAFNNLRKAGDQVGDNPVADAGEAGPGGTIKYVP